MNREKPKLYRKHNKRVIASRCHFEEQKEFRHQRNTKEFKNSEKMRGSMHSTRQLGVDFTPLYRFLHSKVGHKWDDVQSEALSRLDEHGMEGIEHAVDIVPEAGYPPGGFFRVGESSYWSSMYVDENGFLQFVDPEERPKIQCLCCTHTFNGVPMKLVAENYWSPEKFDQHKQWSKEEKERRKADKNKIYSFKKDDETNTDLK